KLYMPQEHAAYLAEPAFMCCKATAKRDLPPITAPRYDDPLIGHQLSYLNGGGGSGKTTRAIELFHQKKTACLHPNPSPSQRDVGQRCKGPNLPLVLPLV
ncbi:MAG: hypothetical protein AB2556_25500, partial [Candidatus Thiodiazotropha sp.]